MLYIGLVNSTLISEQTYLTSSIPEHANEIRPSWKACSLSNIYRFQSPQQFDRNYTNWWKYATDGCFEWSFEAATKYRKFSTHYSKTVFYYSQFVYLTFSICLPCPRLRISFLKALTLFSIIYVYYNSAFLVFIYYFVSVSLKLAIYTI